MKRKYTVPEMEITQFEMKDIVTDVSNGTEPVFPNWIEEKSQF